MSLSLIEETFSYSKQILMDMSEVLSGLQPSAAEVLGMHTQMSIYGSMIPHVISVEPGMFRVFWQEGGLHSNEA